MNNARRAAEVLILSFGLIAVILNGPCLADSMSMQFNPPNAKFTYRLTADNKIILPGPVQVRFSRSDSDILCNKVVEVGAYTSGMSLVTNNAAPGTSDPYKVLFTSPISGGAALCNFNFNDNLITLKTSYSTDRGISDLFTEWKNPLSENYYKNRRTQRTILLNFTPDYNFKVFIKKNGGGYEWRNPAFTSPTVKDKGGLYGIPFEVIVDPIPNTPPRIDKLTLSPTPLPASGVPIKISMIASDDLGVKNVSATASSGTTILRNFSLTTDGTSLGKTPDGRLISLWEGTYYADPNTSTYHRYITLTFKASDEEGAISNPAGEVRQVEQLGVPDTQAPKIDNVTITPQNFPSTGGNVTVSVRASDNAGIVSVRLDLTLPDGQIRPMNMSFATGSCYANGPCINGEWKSSWNMWANSSNTQAVYGVKVTVMDASRNTVSSQSFPITVAGAPRTSIKTPTSGPTGLPAPTRPVLPTTPPQIK
jgi:hypothetical protein